jgi:hypothetical protein
MPSWPGHSHLPVSRLQIHDRKKCCPLQTSQCFIDPRNRVQISNRYFMQPSLIYTESPRSIFCLILKAPVLPMCCLAPRLHIYLVIHRTIQQLSLSPSTSLLGVSVKLLWLFPYQLSALHVPSLSPGLVKPSSYSKRA